MSFVGIHKHTCDSCSKIVDVLFPVAILDEMPTGGEQMVQRWYCVECCKEIIAEAEEVEEEDEDESNFISRKREHECGCTFLSKLAFVPVWGLLKNCNNHWRREENKIIYSCGCTVTKFNEDVYIYTNECPEHEQEK